MKLIFCPYCGDVVRLKKSVRYCECNKVHGNYIGDTLESEISKDAVLIAFSNKSFIEAVKTNPVNITSSPFQAFVLPKEKK